MSTIFGKTPPGRPPQDPERIETARTGEQTRPEDPGDHAVEATVGPTLEFGGPLDAPRSTLDHSPRLGGELTLQYLSLAESHSVSDWRLASEFQAIRAAQREATPYRLAPRLTAGSNYEFRSRDAGFYAEGGAAYPGRVGLSAGYGTRPAGDTRSVRTTLTLWGLIRVRYARRLDGVNEVSVGFSLRSGHTVVWSR